MLPVAGLLLVALCCAGPFLVAGLGTALVLTALRVRLVLIIVTLAVAALVAVIIFVRTQRTKKYGRKTETNDEQLPR
jgi:membrane protein implicated in regulation of membrane protease activity